jgi:hypothetical protein
LRTNLHGQKGLAGTNFFKLPDLKAGLRDIGKREVLLLPPGFLRTDLLG